MAEVLGNRELIRSENESVRPLCERHAKVSVIIWTEVYVLDDGPPLPIPGYRDRAASSRNEAKDVPASQGNRQPQSVAWVDKCCKPNIVRHERAFSSGLHHNPLSSSYWAQQALHFHQTSQVGIVGPRKVSPRLDPDLEALIKVWAPDQQSRYERYEHMRPRMGVQASANEPLDCIREVGFVLGPDFLEQLGIVLGRANQGVEVPDSSNSGGRGGKHSSGLLVSNRNHPVSARQRPILGEGRQIGGR